MTASIFPVQVTITSRHKDSESSFYQPQWANWQAGLEFEGYSVCSIFVWVKDSAPATGNRPAVTRVTRGRSKEVEPAHQFCVVSFKTLAPELHNWLHRQSCPSSINSCSTLLLCLQNFAADSRPCHVLGFKMSEVSMTAAAGSGVPCQSAQSQP